MIYDIYSSIHWAGIRHFRVFDIVKQSYFMENTEEFGMLKLSDLKKSHKVFI